MNTFGKRKAFSEKEKKKINNSIHKRKSPILVAAFACIIFLSLSLLLSLSTPALASDVVFGPGKSIMAVICVEAKGDYKDYVPHYNDHFPPGSTVKIYVEASGKTTENTVTGERTPSIQFKMTGTRPTGATFSASTSSSKLINHDKTLYKETYGIISFSIGKDAVIGDYRFRVEATDSNKGGERIGRTPYMHFYVHKDATLYPPINYTYSDLKVEPNPAEVGTTVVVTVNVTNSGGKGNWKGETVYLDVNGTKVKATRTLKLATNENDTATFRLTKEELGAVPAAFNISIDGLNETLILKEKAPTDAATSGSGAAGGRNGGKQAVPGFTAVSAIAAFCFVLVYQRLSRKER